MNTLIIDVSDILTTVGTKKEFKFENEFKPLYAGKKLNFTGPLNFNFFIENVGLELLVKGDVQGKLRFTCNRCLIEFKAKVKVNLDEVFTLEKNEFDTKETFKVVDNKIDLRGAVEQAFLLELPIRPICKENCKGLCFKCGQNLNLSKCNCLDEKIDVRLLKLKKLKEELEKNRD
ncbi:DUF177 domain-containing protein [Candidatus Oleimmundimicrobium sp.]|uniref:YceD family protein n=1 Tax=Candidatus Oleimmundimicrobium sp. TaxID=3060597 RepID=UPI002721DC9B|nr:DUF177 domain-containing protein [Candidatus Oleimmundimicrobium sp.]MDO8885346.1 DUF177 domain-containing protein [Candidatus Oleimmundimicrobium sp.]